MRVPRTHFYYKGFTTDIYYSPEDDCFYGKINDIFPDLATFESQYEDTIEEEFHKAVDDYISWKTEEYKRRKGIDEHL